MNQLSDPRIIQPAAIGEMAERPPILRGLFAKTSLACVLLFFAGITASATTYFIDYAAGSDSNSGTSKTTPWKRHPFMQGFAGSYQHAGGDRFIFRGGVTWPVGCFQLKVSAGGVSDSVRDYYGTDPSWYSGTSFTRALFDFQNTKIGSGFTGSGIHITAGFIDFGDGLDLARHRADYVYGGMTISIYGAVNSVKLTNCVVHDWSLAAPVASGQDGGGGIGFFGGGGGSSLEVDHCTFHQANAATINGTAVMNLGTCKFTEVYHTASALHGGGNLHDNSLHDLLDTSDAAQHTDAIITFCPSTIYNNLIYNLVGRCAPIELCAPSSGAVNGSDTVYNNIVYNCGAQPPLWTKVDNGNYASYGLVAYNNLLEHGSGYCSIIEAGYSGALFGFLNAHDNVFITTGPALVYGGNYASAIVTSVTNVNNTVAGSLAGYSPSNNYNPTGARGPVGNIGAAGLGSQTPTAPPVTPLSAVLNTPAVGAKITGTTSLGATALPGSSGAGITQVQFLVDGTKVASATSSSSSYVVSWDSRSVVDGAHSISAIATDSSGSQMSSSSALVTVANVINSAQSGSAMPGSSWSATAGSITAPFAVATSGNIVYLVQSASTGSTDGGTAVYGFDTASAGTYSVSGTFNTPDQDHNSFYVTMETDGAATEANVWDMPVTAGAWQTATVSWRGTGSNLAPQFPVKTWMLSSGHHTLTVIGREGGAMLSQVSIVTIAAAPVTPTVTPLSVVLSSPTVGAKLTGTTSFAATALPGSSGAAVTKVQFLIDGALAATATSSSSGYVATWDSRTVADGAHLVAAVATDSSGSQATAASISVTVANTASIPSGAALIGLSWPATSGVIVSPLLSTTGGTVAFVSQSVSTGSTDGGKASYSFDTTTAGTYSVAATFSTPDQDHNSFYVTMETDGAPTEANVWDMPITGSGWQTAKASWRGTGSNVAPQIPVKTWSLPAGHHTLTFIGREAGAMLQQVSVVKIPTPPANLRIVANF